ncbi:MAG: glucose-6-phosphate isomerase [Maricaulis sp.]|jgi:glucose-6-phosphate isomerase|nr:glucose-6-phosphate isomerase [Maricaulis sp.]HAQ36767.1 glucose-6-phosphate isomerase [Alphaproteobacteria bacterium]
MTRLAEQGVSELAGLAREEGAQDARDFFRNEPGRVDALTIRAAGITADFSKQSVSQTCLEALVRFADASGIDEAIANLASGAPVNVTEQRAASHMALRGAGRDESGKAAARSELDRAMRFANALRAGEISGVTGKPLRNILHIGIGGSDLGPRLIAKALGEAGSPVRARFLASPDPDAFAHAVRDFDPAETLVFVVSKSFGTAETKANGAAAREWLEAGLGTKDVSAHLAAASAAPDKAAAFGVPGERVFEMWDWVGGRYSLWSAVSMTVMAVLGEAAFRALLQGAAAMDDHFTASRLDRNMPVVMALAAYWNRVFLGRQSAGLVPYATRLSLLPAWLQQLSMESLGKRTGLAGDEIGGDTGAIIWGAEGPNGQHAFFQLLHQGSTIVPVDIIAVREANGDPVRHRMMLTNALGQAEALLSGRSFETASAELAARSVDPDEIRRLAPHLVMPGGRPTNFLMLDRLDPYCVGGLLALYEHSVFVQSVLFGINAFDQYGVELGKTLASTLERELETGASGIHDPSTMRLLGRVRGDND